jgi:poly(3-hydroxyalkanoate) synthetase
LGFSKNNQNENAFNMVAYTGGEEINYQFGADVKIKSYLIGFQYLKPLVQNWNEGYSRHEEKVSFRLLYFFN